MVQDLNMIKKVYSQFSQRIETTKKVLNRPLTLTEKILLEALEAKDDNVSDRHFTYNSLIDLYYKQRESSPERLSEKS